MTLTFFYNFFILLENALGKQFSLFPRAFLLSEGHYHERGAQMAKKAKVKGWVKKAVIALIAIVAASNIKPLKDLVGPGA